MNCNYKVKITDIQTKYKFKVFCTGYDDSEIKEKIDAMYQAWPKASGEGETPTLDNTANATMTIDLKGNISQETTTGINKIKLVDKSSTTTGGVTYNINNQVLTLSGTSTGINILIDFNDITLPAGTYYFYLLRTKTTRVDISLRTTNNAQISGANFGNVFQNTLSNKAFTLSTDTLIHSMNLWFPSGIDTTDTYKVMICSASHTAEEYEPYTNGSSPNPDYPQDVHVVTGDNTIKIANEDSSESQNYTINLGDMELCKIGDYQDYIYKEGKKWYKYGVIDKIVLDGTQNITLTTSGTRRFNATYTALGISNVKEGISAEDTTLNYRMNDHFIYSAGQTTWGRYYLYNNWLVLMDSGSAIASANDLKTWLGNNNTSIYYVLATPETTEITDATLISQLNALAGAESYSGQTNISQTNDDKPFILTTKALKDLSNL